MTCLRSACALGLVALVLAAPADAGRVDDEDGGNLPGGSAVVLSGGAPLRAVRHLARSRRRKERSSPDARREPTAATFDAAAAYLRCRTARTLPPKEAAAAWDEFYAWADDRIRRFAGAQRAQNVDVDECAQEVWADLTVRLQSFKTDPARGSFASWLHAVVRNKSADLTRRRARRPTVSLNGPQAQEPADSRTDPARLCERRAEREAVRGVMGEMKSRSSEQSYRVLHMRYVEGKAVSEVALALGMTPGQVWTREHRIKRRFRELYQTGRDV
jgi:RNA polymerase sigma factor (sigma-70 family)